MYSNILVPTDGSETASRGLREAIKLAQALGSRIKVVHVLNKTPWLAPGIAPSVVDDLVAELRSSGEAALRRAMSEISAAGVKADQRLIEALGEQVGELVVAEAKAWPAQLIVCGTHGRRGVRRILVGSDAEYILRHSPVPVLLVRDGAS